MVQRHNEQIKLIDVKADNTTDYKYTSLLFVFPYCSNKCKNCQNYEIQNMTPISYLYSSIINFYNQLTTHKSIVCAGLEPFDSFEELQLLFDVFMKNHKPVDFVIYTGYEYEEIKDKVKILLTVFNNNQNFKSKLIIKFGRYDENKFKTWHSELLGVDLATNNQYVSCYSFSENKTLNSVSESEKFL